MFNIRVAYQTSNCEVCESRKESVDQDIEKSDFEKALTESVLTASPFIDYEPPYLESVRGRNCSLLPYFNVPVYQFSLTPTSTPVLQKKRAKFSVPSTSNIVSLYLQVLATSMQYVVHATPTMRRVLARSER